MAHYLSHSSQRSRILIRRPASGGGSASMRSIMRFGLLLLSCRGEGL